MARREQMKKVEAVLAQYRARIEEKERERAALRSEMIGVQKAFDTLSGKLEPAMAPVVTTAHRPRSNVKQTVLSLLREAGTNGTNASRIVDEAARRNETLQQNTVSSLLSRFKADGLASYDGSYYRLKEFAPQKDIPVH